MMSSPETISLREKENEVSLNVWSTPLPLLWSFVFDPGLWLTLSSPEPLAHGELLLSLDVRRVSSVVNNCFKGSSPSTAGWIFTKLGSNKSYMALFNNCSNGYGPLHI